MTELDRVWSKMLEDAGTRASGDVAEYLRLKASNDAIRTAGVGWLFDTMIEIAGREMRARPHLNVEITEPHNFKHGNSNMVGRLVSFRLGVRCLDVEAGWARTPSDGIMRNGSLAVARFSHFGQPKHNSEFRFMRREPLPAWIGPDDEDADSRLFETHFSILLDG
ncbi:MAG: hypothetical protein ABL959_04905 [Pyrinomonadaceae bacterium]